MISQESTTKDVKLVGYDFRGHTRGTLVVGIAYGCPYYKGSAIFFTFFFVLSTTSEKLFIPYKASAAVQAHKVCPVRPSVLVVRILLMPTKKFFLVRFIALFLANTRP